MKRSLRSIGPAFCATVLAAALLAACSSNSTSATTVHRAYVANIAAGTVSGYTIDTTSGELTSTGTATAGSLPDSVAIDRSGRFAYVANLGDNSISAFTIDARAGVLASAGTVTTGGTGAQFVSVDPLSRFVFAASWSSSDVSVYTINASTGALTKTDCGGGAGCNGSNFAVGSIPNTNVAFDPAGKYAYLAVSGADTVVQYDVDQATGALSNGVAVAAGTFPGYVVVHPAGTFAYAANTTSGDISAYTVSATTGTLAQIDCGGGTGCNGKNFVTGAAPMGLVIDPTGAFLYAANYNDNTISAFTIDAATGALAAVAGSPYAVDGNAYGDASVAIDPSGRFLYATSVKGNDVAGFAIDGATGQLTPLTASPFAAGVQPYGIATTTTSY